MKAIRFRRGMGLAWTVLFLASLACSAAGEILSPEEATARAQATARPQVTAAAGGQTTFNVDDTVEFISSEFLILMRKVPGDLSDFATQATRGEKATVLDFEEVNGEEWYLVRGPAGQGWVPVRFLKGVGAAAATGPQVGDTVYLAGRNFLISLMDAPGSQRMIAGQERNTEVVILEIADQDGETWYKIDAPTGEGWVPAENISTEEP